MNSADDQPYHRLAEDIMREKYRTQKRGHISTCHVNLPEDLRGIEVIIGNPSTLEDLRSIIVKTAWNLLFYNKYSEKKKSANRGVGIILLNYESDKDNLNLSEQSMINSVRPLTNNILIRQAEMIWRLAKEEGYQYSRAHFEDNRELGKIIQKQQLKTTKSLRSYDTARYYPQVKMPL